jgi:hypothetical protein
MDLLQWLNWPLRLLFVGVIRPLGRVVTDNPMWPDEPPPPP